MGVEEVSWFKGTYTYLLIIIINNWNNCILTILLIFSEGVIFLYINDI